MYDVFTKCGFRDVTKSVDLATGTGLKRSDVLLNHQHHVAMYCGNGKEVEASINEKGTATGGIPGDQTGKEFLVRSYRNYPWNVVLRYQDSGSEVTNSTTTDSTTTKQTWSGYLNQSAKVRTWAGSEYKEVSFSPLKKGTAVEVQYTIKDTIDRDWHFVKYKDKFGFILAKYISKKKDTVAGTKTTTRYRVQSGVYGVKANAKTRQAQLKKQGYESIIINVDKKYIVQLGMFDKLANAKAFVQELNDAGINPTIVAVK